ncbi:hypothetical protein EVJ58_g6452 [Rhodofomes roseus]|uniref:Aminoglycoside phosphotransferase domain-containing protein n=1 Tax=Rhodofomes roseus TaxID=34475 RepID=A0A4Y9Y789_9APHY|nr:hypothetical protein EVJ58_g6452 [Rhodofomes roseus]
MASRTQESETSPELDLVRITLPTLPSVPLLSAPSVFNVGARRLYDYSPTAILKMGTDEGEGVMTALARSILGPVVPEVLGVVTVPHLHPRARHGLLLARQPGTPLVTIWPSLQPMQRADVKNKLCDLVLRMRMRQFSYYGRPGGLPYTTETECGTAQHTFCTTRTEWNESRIRALQTVAPSIDIDEPRRLALEQMQKETICDDRPVLTHGDLSSRNILVHPDTLEVTGFLDWEMANVMPAYFEYVLARLSGGHQAEWRKELLDVLKNVLRVEAQNRAAQQTSVEDGGSAGDEEYGRALKAWNRLVDVERSAQEYSDRCYWTFEDNSQ